MNRKNWIAIALAATALFCFFSYIRRGGDFSGYLLVGEQVAQGGHIYHDVPPRINTWPPFFSLLCYPLHLLSIPTPLLARGVWLILTFALLLWSMHLICLLVYKRRLTFRTNPDPGSISIVDWAVLIPLVVSARFVIANLQHLQINILLLALTVAALYFHSQKKDAAGGLFMGIAISVKVIPIAFVGYFVYRRQWKIVLYSVIATLLLTLSPVLIFGWEKFIDYLWSWYSALRAGWGISFMNQSVLAMWDRQLPHSMEWAIFPAYVCSLVLVGIASLWFFRGPYNPETRVVLAEWSIVSIVMVLFGPVSWKAFFVFFLLPYSFLYAVSRSPDVSRSDKRLGSGILWMSFIFSFFTMPVVIGESLAELIQEWSVLTIISLLMLILLFWLRAKLSKVKFM